MIDGTDQAAAFAARTTVRDLPALLHAARLRLAQDCPAGGDTALLRLMVLNTLEWAELLAGYLADRVPAPAQQPVEADLLEIPRVPRFGTADAAGADHGLAPGRPHP